MRRMAAVVLVCCLLLTCVPVRAASQSQFSDLDQIKNRSEVLLLVALGMISGHEDGTFRPQDTLTRAQTAKLLALMCTDEPEGRLGGRFTDVSGGWAAPYIAYCADRGILSGYEGLFRPNDLVTGRELAKMLLVAVGYDSANYVGADWAEAVDADAMEAGIYARYPHDPELAIDRDYACLLIYNAMQSLAVEGYEADGTPVYVTDELLNPKTYLENRFGVVRYTNVLVANEYVDLQEPGRKLQPGYSRLDGHTDFAVSTELSMIGKCVDIYLRDGQVIGEPCLNAAVTTATFRGKAEMERLFRNTDYALAYDAAYYYNYTVSNRQTLNQLSDGAEITVLDLDGDRRFEQILMTVYTQGTVLNPDTGLVRLADGKIVMSQPFRRGAAFPVGCSVRCIQIAGIWYIQ